MSIDKEEEGIATIGRMPSFFMELLAKLRESAIIFSVGNFFYDGLLAQLVEQLTLNQRVGGSNPS